MNAAQELTATGRRRLREEATDWDRLSDQELTRLFEKGRAPRVRVRRPLPKVFSVAVDESARRKQTGAGRRVRERAESRARRTV
jgi:hypothetical protein